MDDPRETALREITDEAPALRTGLFDISTESFKAFERALAERMAVPPDEVSAMMTARRAFQLFEIVADRWRCGDLTFVHRDRPGRSPANPCTA